MVNGVLLVYSKVSPGLITLSPSPEVSIELKVANLKGIEDVQVDIVWEPQWDQSMMTEAAKLQLGMM